MHSASMMFRDCPTIEESDGDEHEQGRLPRFLSVVTRKSDILSIIRIGSHIFALKQVTLNFGRNPNEYRYDELDSVSFTLPPARYFPQVYIVSFSYIRVCHYFYGTLHICNLINHSQISNLKETKIVKIS